MIAHLLDETTLFSVLHGYFDRIFLSEASVWFGGESREDLYRTAIERGLREKAVPHGEVSKVYIEHIFFRGKLPRFLGFDYSFENIGSRSTVSLKLACSKVAHLHLLFE